MVALPVGDVARGLKPPLEESRDSGKRLLINRVKLTLVKGQSHNNG